MQFSLKSHILVCGFATAAISLLFVPAVQADYIIKEEIRKGERDTDILPWLDNRTHRKSNTWLTVNNWGWMGNYNDYDSDAYIDDETQDWAPQCEYPGGSDVQYLFAASLWVGALIIDDYGLATARVSTGADGYVAGQAHEFYPDDASPIEERSTLVGSRNKLGDRVHHEKAISEQDFLSTYTDTLVDGQLTPPVDGIVHEPLGIRIRQKSMSWSYEYASDLVVIEYEVENVASKFLKNLFIGLYVDGDVGRRGFQEKNLDDIAGFITQAYDSARGQWLDVNTAWIADNDGRDIDIDLGNDLTCPHVTGFRVLRSPNPKLETSFNWWTSSLNLDQDFGPTWASHALGEDGNWTTFRGTPLDDKEKYFILSNEEFDYNQWFVNNDGFIEASPQQWVGESGSIVREEPWLLPSDSQVDAEDVANGYDTRYLVSWGPMGVFDHVDNTGRWIYRLNPGEKFSFTVALVAGENFHDSNHPQQLDGALDPDLVNFRSLENAALWASRIYDNEMVDTPIFDFGEDGVPDTEDLGEGDGLLDTGDGWFGEDLGSDGLFAHLPADQDSVPVWYFGHFMGYYSGPDEDGSENNNLLDPGEDELLWQLQNFVTDSGFVYAGPLLSEGGHAWVPDGQGGRVERSFGTTTQADWFIGHLNLNGVLDRGDGIPDFQGPPPPPPPVVHVETEESAVILRWNDFSERAVDPFSHLRDFEGYRVWVGNENQEGAFSLLGEWDRIDYAYFDREGLIRTPPDTRPWEDAPLDSIGWSRQTIASNVGLLPIRKPHGQCESFDDDNGDLVYNAPEAYHDANQNGTWDPGEAFEDQNYNHQWDAGEDFDDENENGFWDAHEDYTVYELRIEPVHALFPRYYSVTAFDFGDFLTGTKSLESAKTASAVMAAPSGRTQDPVLVVPNPYRLDADYTRPFMAGAGPQGWEDEGLSWENQDDGSADFWPQQDRRMDFVNLPKVCLIRIFTVSGDLVQVLPHNLQGDHDRNWQSPYSESWNLNNRNFQMVAPGLYIYSVEDKTDEGKGKMQTGKFVIIG
jgi:hypothetical protein